MEDEEKMMMTMRLYPAMMRIDADDVVARYYNLDTNDANLVSSLLSNDHNSYIAPVQTHMTRFVQANTHIATTANERGDHGHSFL